MRIRSELIRFLVFSLVALLCGLLLLQVLTRARVGDTDHYSAQFANASGIEGGDLVRVAGVVVGQVKNVDIDEGNLVRVDFEVENDLRLTDATEVAVRYENLLGDRYLQLAQRPGKGVPLSAETVIPTSRTSPALDLDVLLNGFKPLFAGLDGAQVNELAENIVQTLQGRSGTVEQLLSRTGALTNAIADKDAAIGTLVTNLNVVLAHLDENDSQLRGTLTQLQRLVSGLAKDRDPIGQAVTSLGRMTVSLEDLLRSIRPALRTDIERTRLVTAIVNRNAEEVQRILVDVPRALQILNRVGSHGALFNFYLCGVNLRIDGPSGPMEIPGMKANSSSKRCQPLEDQ